MKATEHLSALLHAQKQTLWELEAEIASLSAKDFLTENDRLKAELAHTANRCRQAEQTRDTLKKELEAVQEALHAKLYSEKQLALRLASKRLSAYYQAQDAAEENRLVAFEKTMRKRIELLQRQAKEEDEALFSELSAEFDRLRALLDERITRLRSEREANAAALQEGAAPAFSALQNEPLTGQEARAALRGRRFEALIGLSVFNKIGVLLIVIGSVAAARFTYTKLPDSFKGGMLFLLAFLFLGVGGMDGARRQAAGSVFTRPIRRRGRTALCQRGHLFFLAASAATLCGLRSNRADHCAGLFSLPTAQRTGYCGFCHDRRLFARSCVLFSAGDTAAASPDQRAVFCRAVLVLSADGVP